MEVESLGKIISPKLVSEDKAKNGLSRYEIQDVEEISMHEIFSLEIPKSQIINIIIFPCVPGVFPCV